MLCVCVLAQSIAEHVRLLDLIQEYGSCACVRACMCDLSCRRRTQQNARTKHSAAQRKRRQGEAGYLVLGLAAFISPIASFPPNDMHRLEVAEKSKLSSIILLQLIHPLPNIYMVPISIH